MKIVDTKGHTCPRPLIMLKEALLELKQGDQLQVITDNETSLKNLISYLKDQGANPTVDTAGNVHTITTVRPDTPDGETNPATYCSTEIARTDYVVCLKSNRMGEGDPDLGKVLMETFVENLKLQDHLPTHVVMYNAGVKLAMKESPVCSSLSELEELGCRIMLCGTCIDHYGLQYEIGVGMISNMVCITEILVQTGHVITP
ncbi:MAG: sulfurtransferase-like selenium metabolism protein YedF [Bacteroidetes bacterium]|nr:sulfurtransferase-like selenium metabolism protein YedF [Bacteroidota bacterium]